MMKFSQELSASGIAIDAYDPQGVTLSMPGNRSLQLQQSFIVSPGRLIEHWEASSATTLNAASLAVLMEFEAEVILLGTGERHIFPHASVMAGLINNGVGIEVMNSLAACRTYNILAGEGRQVVAAIIV